MCWAFPQRFQPRLIYRSHPNWKSRYEAQRDPNPSRKGGCGNVQSNSKGKKLKQKSREIFLELWTILRPRWGFHLMNLLIFETRGWPPVYAREFYSVGSDLKNKWFASHRTLSRIELKHLQQSCGGYQVSWRAVAKSILCRIPDIQISGYTNKFFQIWLFNPMDTDLIWQIQENLGH